MISAVHPQTSPDQPVPIELDSASNSASKSRSTIKSVHLPSVRAARKRHAPLRPMEMNEE